MFKFAMATAALMLGTAATAAIVVATRDWDGGEYLLPGVGLATASGGGSLAGSEGIIGFGANYYRNSTTGIWFFTLSNLPAHTSVTIDIDLVFIDSWDSTDGSCCSPDILTWSIDGVDLYDMTANNTLGTVNDFAGGMVQQGPSHFVGNATWNDRVVDMSTSTLATFAHTGDTLIFALRAGGGGWQGGDDESWGFDNLVISIEPTISTIPEPATWAMLIAGFGLVGIAARRRRTLTA